MKIFFKKLFLLIVVSIVMSLLYMGVIDSKTKKSVQNPTLEKKAQALLEKVNNPEIIIIGDSRSLNNLIPKVMKEELHTPVINLSFGGLDLITAYKLLEKFNLLNPGKTIIISISESWIEENTYSFSDVFIPNMSIREKVTYCYTSELNCKFLANYYGRTAVKFFFDFIGYKSRDAYKDEDSKEDGYVALENQSDVTAANQGASSFESAVHYGGRAKLFSRTLELLGKSGAKVFLYESPTRPVANYHIGAAYKKLINDSIKDYPNVTLLNFDPYKSDLTELDKGFFDRVHLKREGAQLFTKVMSKMISQKN